MIRSAPVRLVGLAALTFAFFALGMPAVAHAVLLGSDPAAGARVERAPQSVTLTFDENVESDLGSLRVLDAAGTERSRGPVVHPGGDGQRVQVRVGALDRGRYVVAWQVVSADSHLVNGAFAFGVGVDAGAQPILPADNGAKLLLPILHFMLLAGVLLGIGLPIGAFALARSTRVAANPLEFGAWFVVAFAAFADVAFRSDLAGGSLTNGFTTHVGVLRAVTIVAAFIGIVALIGKRRRLFVLAPACVAVALSLSLAGHAAEGTFAISGVIADVAHLLAAATWIGVLAIATTLEDTPALVAITPVALTAVCVLILSGIVQTIYNVGSLSALLGTAYGRAIDVKIVLLLVLIAIAAGARSALARGFYAIGLRIKIELWLLTAVIAVTAVLVEQPLPREAAPLASVTASYALRNFTVNAVVTSTGANTWDVRVTGTAPLDEVDAGMRETQRNVGPLTVALKRVDNATYDGTVTLPFAGAWTATISARSGAFDEAHRTISLPETAP
jgi:copper transport protein